MPFLVFEGLDGSGKSSLMASFEAFLKDKKLQVIKTREPGGTSLGDEIRNLILRTEGPSPTPRTELLLYEASRSQHVDLVIRPAVQSQKWVLCDRFTASSIAFQAGGREISEAWVEKLNAFATDELHPDLTILLDLSVEESRKRRRQREIQGGEKADRMESEADSFHEKVRQSFLNQAQKQPYRWLVLNASEPPKHLLEALIQHVRGLDWPGF